MKILIQLLLVLFISLSTSCIKRDFEIKGVVINKSTGLVMEGVKVVLQDGLEGQDSFIGGTEPENFDSVFSNSNGKFKVSIRTSSSNGFIYGQKDGYRQITEQGTIQGVNRIDDKNDSYIIEMEGYAYFNSPFQKNSGAEKSTDSLIFAILSYEDLKVNLNYYDTKIKKGKSPFYFWDENSPVGCKGDRYLRYKLEWTTDGIWHNKIDSVYIPTSKEVYKETIYY